MGDKCYRDGSRAGRLLLALLLAGACLASGCLDYRQLSYTEGSNNQDRPAPNLGGY